MQKFKTIVQPISTQQEIDNADRELEQYLNEGWSISTELFNNDTKPLRYIRLQRRDIEAEQKHLYQLNENNEPRYVKTMIMGTTPAIYDHWQENDLMWFVNSKGETKYISKENLDEALNAFNAIHETLKKKYN